MATDADLLWSYLHVLTKERHQALKEIFGNLEEARKYLNEELLTKLGCREETVMKSMMRIEGFDAGRYRKELEKRHIQFLCWEDEEYPSLLREIGDPPPFLYVRGDLSLLDQPCIGLVGTRKMTQYGRRVTGRFVPEFIAAGMVTVSGLADGIDAVVAEETLRVGGKTVAVLGHGLGMIYPPKNAKLAQNILDAGGMLISEFPLDFEPGKFTFPARNRIIAGLTIGTVVLEAPEGSGAIITADLALEYGREVFAVPGDIFDPNYAGCHALIAKGAAKLVTDPVDVLREIGVIAPAPEQRSTFIPQGEDEKAVFAALTTMPQEVDTLVERSKLDAARVGVALTMMELRGGARNIGGGMWVKT